jgi:hypothetical protein
LDYKANKMARRTTVKRHTRRTATKKTTVAKHTRKIVQTKGIEATDVYGAKFFVFDDIESAYNALNKNTKRLMLALGRNAKKYTPRCENKSVAELARREAKSRYLWDVSHHHPDLYKRFEDKIIVPIYNIEKD